MERSLEELLAGLKLAAPANSEEIGKVGAALPSDYLEFLRISNGCSGFFGKRYLILYSLERIAAVNKTLNPRGNIVFFGSDGGETGYAFGFKGDVLEIPFDTNLEKRKVVSAGFLGFLENLRKSQE
ncbi:MAG: SMI1/KNR4 family protein [archaeon]